MVSEEVQKEVISKTQNFFEDRLKTLESHHKSSYKIKMKAIQTDFYVMTSTVQKLVEEKENLEKLQIEELNSRKAINYSNVLKPLRSSESTNGNRGVLMRSKTPIRLTTNFSTSKIKLLNESSSTIKTLNSSSKKFSSVNKNNSSLIKTTLTKNSYKNERTQSKSPMPTQNSFVSNKRIVTKKDVGEKLPLKNEIKKVDKDSLNKSNLKNSQISIVTKKTLNSNSKVNESKSPILKSKTESSSAVNETKKGKENESQTRKKATSITDEIPKGNETQQRKMSKALEDNKYNKRPSINEGNQDANLKKASLRRNSNNLEVPVIEKNINPIENNDKQDQVDVIEKGEIEKTKLNEDIEINKRRKSSIVKSTNEILPVREIKNNFPKPKEDKFSIVGDNKMLKSLAISLIEGYFTPNLTTNLLISNKCLLEILKINKVSIINRYIHHYEHKLQELKHYTDNPVVDSLLEKVFAPSKTSINGIKFFNKNEELSLIQSDQPEEIINVFKFIFIILDEDYSNFTKEGDIINYFFKEIFDKYNIDSTKNFFQEKILKNAAEISNSQIKKLIDIVQTYPKIIQAHEIIKINKTVSYMCFVLKDIFDFVAAKFEDVYLYRIKEMKLECKEVENRIEFLKNII